MTGDVEVKMVPADDVTVDPTTIRLIIRTLRAAGYVVVADRIAAQAGVVAPFEDDGPTPTAVREVPEGSIVLTPDGFEGWEYTANALDYVANNYGDYTATLGWLALKIREQMPEPEPQGFGTMLRDKNGELWQRVTATNTWFSRNYGGVRWGDPLIQLPVEVVYQGEVE